MSERGLSHTVGRAGGAESGRGPAARTPLTCQLSTGRPTSYALTLLARIDGHTVTVAPAAESSPSPAAAGPSLSESTG